MICCDLHTHSRYSDGSDSPAALIRMAEERGLGAIALTDHNTAAGLPEFMEAGERSRVAAVPGCEFSTEFERREVHIVGLFFPKEAWPEINDYVDLLRVAKDNSNRRLIAALRADGYDISYEEVAALTDSSVFNRAHVARVLCAKGVVNSVPEAFSALLDESRGYYKPAKRLNPMTTIRFIKMYGGKAVLAHPFLSLSYDGVRNFLPQAIEAGLDAIETHYSLFDAAATQQAEALATEFGLLQSGGSDYHGKAKPDISLGSGRGNLAVPMSFFEALRRA
ncbi:MAG: PHP domain-containing protein [Clostridia bacterium]|nr:PHP domain-containing protein [Clostridia bacterium]